MNEVYNNLVAEAEKAGNKVGEAAILAANSYIKGITDGVRLAKAKDEKGVQE